ncbi:hypothetical protein JM18_007480 [Phytophthora kernoviae]|uniref:UVR domain-containing protein n=2 Tax=Phytophthora kernoviae TaxID=325452 RepID=A0A8T0LQM2_9STRA|nr:hypothetical protein G195_008944 [Phytophthora kernoviae 00238/432]KAG2517179.1 hypothetical protein JM16_007498 [Phytophthora kernoviae]KAG2519682.1 hypothetical protein JM18_007480 [Phytophthora kernoviae]
MFGRFFKNKDDGKNVPPGHQRQGQNGAEEPPVGGGFFNLPPPVAKPYGGQNAASATSSAPPNAGGAPPGGMDMFGGMSMKKPSAGASNTSGLNIRETPSSSGGDDSSKALYEAPVEEFPAPKVYEEPSPPIPAAPPTPEERLFNTLRDFHASAVSFRENTVKQNEEENRLMERKAQLAAQLMQYEMDLRDVEEQQHHACEIEDFEKADALNATINSVRHCITLTESDVRKLDSELVAFVKAKEKAFANQLKSTRGTLRELEKFREDQETERMDVRNEYKQYEADQTEQLQFEAERIDTEMHHVSVSLENVIAEKSEIEKTVEDQCGPEFAIQAQLLEEKESVEEEVRELERKLKLKLERVQEIQSSIDTAQRDIDTVRKRYSRQLKRIADREEGIQKTKAEVEADGEHLQNQRQEFQEQLKQYSDDITVIGKRIGAVRKEMRAASLLANVLEVQETRREQSLIRKKQQTAELSSLNDATAVAEQSFTMLSNQHEELEKSLSIHRNAIASAEAMIPRLEQEKKAAAAQRNFKEAARISKDIKALEKDRSTAEEMVEVVEMELQDLKERIDKREVEYEEKKKELKEMEKHLELATLQELWKEAKHLRVALRRIEKCKSEGDAADDGIDFRSSAMLLVQAEYDACMLQVETLERKYEVADPTKDADELEDGEEEDDESIYGDDEENDRATGTRSSIAGKSTDVDGSDVDVETSEDGSSALEVITSQLSELESQIDKATENEDYELAARLDEKFEDLKERRRAVEASLSQESGAPDYAGDASEEDADEEHDREYSEVKGDEAEMEYNHEEMVSPVSAAPVNDVRSHDDLTQSLEQIQLRTVMLTKEIELATDNDDYETAASYDEELQSLQVEEKNIREQLEYGNMSAPLNGSSILEGLNVKVEELALVGQLSDKVDMDDNKLESSKGENTELVTSDSSLFGGLQMSSGPPAVSESPVGMLTMEPEIERTVETEEPVAPAKVEVVSPTSTSDMKDSFFGTPQVPGNNASLIAPSASGSLFGGLNMSGSFQVMESTKSTGDTRMSIHELSEHSEVVSAMTMENGDSVTATEVTMSSETTSTETTTTVVSTTTVKLSDEEGEGAAQDTTQP